MAATVHVNTLSILGAAIPSLRVEVKPAFTTKEGDGGALVVPITQVATTDAAGEATFTLIDGVYGIRFGQNPSDDKTFTVPADDGEHDLTDLLNT